jgi:hypothetical protein
MGVLTVTLDKCMNLRDKDGIGRSDPYVIFVSKNLSYERIRDPLLSDTGRSPQPIRTVGPFTCFDDAAFLA